MKIVIVDDEEVIRDSLLKFLNQKGYSCKAHSNAHEALNAIREWRPDLVVTDYKMPGMNGFELLKIIKNKYPEIKVILLTAFANQDNAIIAAEAGAYGTCLKTYDLIKFSKLIKQIEREQNDQR